MNRFVIISIFMLAHRSDPIKRRTLYAIKRWTLQVALDIRGRGIRSFDYSRTQKPRIMRDNCHFEVKLA